MEYIVQEFEKIKGKVVYSAEKNCWPFEQNQTAFDEMCSLFPGDPEMDAIYSPDVASKWLNSGVMICRAVDCVDWFQDTMTNTVKYLGEDDQARAYDLCIKWGDRCKLDYKEKLFRSIHLGKEDMEYRDGKYINIKSNYTPAFIHFNGRKGGYDTFEGKVWNRKKNVHFRNIDFHKNSFYEASYEYLCSKFGNFPYRD